MSSPLTEHILVPAIVLTVLILSQPLLRRILKRKPGLAKLASWISLYAFIIFILAWYQGESWLIRPLLTTGSLQITLNLLIYGFLILSMASRLSGLLTERLMPGIYRRYQLDRGVHFTFNRLFHYDIMTLAFYSLPR